MLLKVVRIIGVSITGMALANVALAENVNVTTGAVSAELGGEFRGEWTHSDNGLQKAEGFTPDASDTIAVQHTRITLDGKINSDTEFAFGFNLLDPQNTDGPLVYGYGTHWFSKMMGMSVGRMTTMIGGWDNMDSGYRDHAQGWAGYESNLPFADYEDMIALHLAVAGKVSLQLVNDKMMDENPATMDMASWNKTSHPTWILGWQGQFGGIQPLVNIGSWDNNKSRWIDVGVKANMSGLLATLDINQQSIVWKGADSDGKAKGVEDSSMAITVKAAYELKGTATPWVYVSTFDRKQADDKDNGSEDVKYNAAGEWNDNAMTYGLGADLHMMGKGWTPYVALVSRSGKWLKNPADLTSDTTESKSEMVIRLGVLGEI